MKDLASLSCRDCINSASLFEGLSFEELDYLVQHASQKSYKKGDIVVKEGDLVNTISFLKCGLLKVFKKSPKYHDQIINLAKPNDCVGLLSVFSSDRFNYNLTAIEDSVLYSIEFSALKHILFTNSSFGLHLLKSISNAADLIISQTIEISKKNSRGRIAYCLTSFAEEIYHRPVFYLPVSRKEIAEMIGLTSENVIRVLTEFRRDGIIAINGKTITILDIERLKYVEKNG